MNGITERQSEKAQTTDLSGVKPLPVWFFAFEGALAAAFDLCKAWDGAWMVLVAIAAVNIVIGLTVLRRRAKLVKAMLKNSRTRKIVFALVALRLAVHGLLGVVGAPVTSTAGHVAVGLVMAAVTVTLLWFDQRVTFRALGLTPAQG
ncbi:hypothetical protein AB0F13_07050 [Streptomyces sp. NPDC026206]|uniref:hypothetical protein n=1 Tax=Streptomyces sp. NPDC026206 TaxID=3157089 RepID=UPI0033CB3C76